MRFGSSCFCRQCRLESEEVFLLKSHPAIFRIICHKVFFVVFSLEEITSRNEINLSRIYSPTQVSGKMAAETGGFRRRFKPPFSQNAKPRHPTSVIPKGCGN